jgi:hypothetical protein
MTGRKKVVLMQSPKGEGMASSVTVKEALDNALQFLESLGYISGDIHDDLALACAWINRRKGASKTFLNG